MARPDYDPGAVGFDGEMPRALAGYRGPYIPRKPVLFGCVIPIERARRGRPPKSRPEVGPDTERRLSDALDRALGLGDASRSTE